VLSSCSRELRRTLERRGYAVVETALHAFLRSGGSACCLTLRLDHQSSRSESHYSLPLRRNDLFAHPLRIVLKKPTKRGCWNA
jgi:hypothetical protein